MATGHLNPGYTDPVSRLRRSKSAVPFDSEEEYLKPIDNDFLEEIRNQARQTWSRPSTAQTTYNDFHNEDYLKTHEQTLLRPTSPSRKNKPHPPLVFLTNRLHYIEGFHNADSTMGKSVYKVDASPMSPIERGYRQSLRSKYEARPRTAAQIQYKRTEGLDALDAVDAQTTEAWLKMSTEKDRRDIIEKLKEIDRTMERKPTPTPIPSLRGYLKRAGYRDRTSWDRLQGNYHHRPETVVMRKYQDATKVGKPVYKSIPARGDFSMHPDWPPTIPHHKLPCLC